MHEKDIFKYGEEIVHSINKAAETGNFSNLSRNITQTLNDAANSLSHTIDTVSTVGSELKQAFSRPKDARTPFFSVKIKRRKGIDKIVIGSITAFVALLMILGSTGIRDCWLSLVILAASVLLILAGKSNRTVIKNYFRFGTIIGKRSYVTVEELADKLGKTTRYVIAQIKQMKKYDYLPYAVMDKEETTLMLTDSVYKEYLKSSYLQARQQESAAAQKDAAPKDASPDETAGKHAKVSYYTIDGNLPKEVQDILREGNDYLNKIRYFNDLIPDTETMSDKLYTLEVTALSIFKKLQESPEIAGDLRKFMSYYLPTTEKLLQSYVDLRNESQTVENITNAQREIEEATDVINGAFVRLLNQLFESTSWDIAADISVMKTMMKQDALL